MYVWCLELGVGKWGSSPFTLALGSREFSCFHLYKSECLGHPRRGSKGFKRLVRDTICFSVSGAFDVDSTLDFDLDHIAGVGGLPPDVTSGTDLLAVSGLGAGDSSVDIDMTGLQSKI